MQTSSTPRESPPAHGRFGALTAFADRLEPFVYAILRIVTGLLFSVHGMQKLFGLASDKPAPDAMSQLWIGAIIELVGGLLIATGLFTRVAAFIASGTMAVAYLQFHWKLAFADLQWLPAVNKGELAVVYCFLFLLFAVRGAPRWSLDALIRRR